MIALIKYFEFKWVKGGAGKCSAISNGAYDITNDKAPTLKSSLKRLILDYKPDNVQCMVFTIGHKTLIRNLRDIVWLHGILNKVVFKKG